MLDVGDGAEGNDEEDEDDWVLKLELEVLL